MITGLRTISKSYHIPEEALKKLHLTIGDSKTNWMGLPGGNLRWIWKVNHDRAILKHIYTQEGNKLYFHFKISLCVIFAQISPKIPKETDYLDVFDSNDNVVFELPVPLPSTYKITKNEWK